VVDDTPGVFTVYVKAGKSSAKGEPNQPGPAALAKATQR
jgi:hypothetical protein